MTRTFILTSFSFLFFSPLFSNNYFYYSPRGPEQLTLAYNRILVQFAEGTDLVAQQEILAAYKFVAPLVATNLLPSPQITSANLLDINSAAEVIELLKKLRAETRVKFAYPVFNYADGTQLGLQAKLLIRLKNATQSALLEDIAAHYNLLIEQQNAFDPLLFHVSITDSATDPLALTQELFEKKLFDYVEPDFLRFLKPMTTNDPARGDQWALDNTGQNSGVPGIAGADLRITEAWRTTTGKSTIKIAIVDEGVDLNHPDLLANILPGYDATEQNSGGAPAANDAHGTACAGIVAAVGNNNLGMVGVAYDSKIIPVRLAYSNGDNWVTSSAWVSNALNWAWQEAGADVISNSWGGGGSSFSINNAIDNAVTRGRNGLGTPVLFAAGNEDTNVSYPADYAAGIAVGAMSMCYERKSPTSCDRETWWGSNYGTHLDVVAPGTRIYATDISGAAGYSSADYSPGFNGTSAATPNVAGVLALILSANANLTVQQARYALESTCRKVGDYTYNTGVVDQPTGSWTNEMGYGLVDAAAAIQAVAPSRENDAGIMEILYPTLPICGETIQPIVKLRNNGSNALRTTNIHIRVGGTEVYTHRWNGNLASTAVEEVALPAVPVVAGVHTLEIYTTTPNGIADSNPDNDGAFTNFSSGTAEFLLKITLDNYGSETSWNLVNAQEEILLSGGPYADNAVGQIIEEKFCLPTGCYALNFFDQYDDGMCCGYGDGSYELWQSAGNELLASGGQFTDLATHEFCVAGTAAPLPDPLNATFSNINHLRCNGENDGSASIDATGGTTPYDYQWSNGSTERTARGLRTGNHRVTVTDAANQTLVRELFIESPTAIQLTTTTQSALNNADGAATANVTGGVAPYFYRWSNGSTNPTATRLTSGIYTVTVTDQNDCSKIASAMVSNEVVVDAAPQIVFEQGKIAAVGDDWQTIQLTNNYTSMVVVASVHYPDVAVLPVVTRLRNTNGNQFEIKLQNPSNNPFAALAVDYFVVEAGVYNETEHGIKMEAVRARSTATASRNSWLRERRDYQNEYEQPVVVGQVMTYNDARWSTFWSSANNQRNRPAHANSFAAGKHVGEDSNTNRANETIGYVVFESGIQQINTTKIYAALGADQVRGISNTTTGYAYNINGLTSASSGIVSAAGMDSNNGGWPVMLGEQAVTGESISLVFDEDQKRDMERAHTSEQVAFLVFEQESEVAETEIAPLVFEHGQLAAVNHDWQRVELEHTYQSMVVVATVVLKNREQRPVVTRIRAAAGNSFSIKTQNPGGRDAGNYQIQYFVVEAGVYNEFDHGVNMEAVRTTSTVTSARRQWKYESQDYRNNYFSPVVLGQVMSYNDERWSSFWSNNGNRRHSPTATRFSIGKHVGEDNVTERADELLGYVVFEAGTGEINGINFSAAVGADRVYGVHNTNNGYRYAVAGAAASSTAILSSTGMDGSDCGWPVLFGTDAVTTDRLLIAIDEDDVTDDERAHPSEQVAYVVFATEATDGLGAQNGNGTQTIIKTEEASEEVATLITYPNPTVDWVTIKSTQILVGTTSVQLFNPLGQLITQQQIQLDPHATQQIRLDATPLASGQYFVNVQNEHQSFTTSFVKQ